MNRLGPSRPADRSVAGLQPLAEEEPEESEGNSAVSGSPEEAAKAESEHSAQPEQQQVAAGMLMTRHVNADSRSLPSPKSSPAAETSSDLRVGPGCSLLRDSLDDQQGSKQALSPTVSLVEPDAVSEPTAADSRDQPILGAQIHDHVQAEHASEPTAADGRDQPIVGAQTDDLLQPEHASQPTSVKSEDQLTAEAERAGLEPKASTPRAAAGSEDPAELEVSEGSGIEEPEQPVSEAQRAKGSALGADSAAYGQPGGRGASPEPASAVAACGAELRPAAAAQGAEPGPHIEGCAVVEACSSPDIDSTASPGQRSAEPLQAVTPGTEQAERQHPPKPQPASMFPTRLLDDFAMIITPVRQLTEAAARQHAPAGGPQAPDPADQHLRRLEDALSEPDDSPELASPVPADRQPISDPEADQDPMPYGHKLASAIRFATPVDGRAAVGAVTPATDRPASASEHQRWEVRALTVFKAYTALLSLTLL